MKVKMMVRDEETVSWQGKAGRSTAHRLTLLDAEGGKGSLKIMPTYDLHENDENIFKPGEWIDKTVTVAVSEISFFAGRTSFKGFIVPPDQKK